MADRGISKRRPNHPRDQQGSDTLRGGLFHWFSRVPAELQIMPKPPRGHGTKSSRSAVDLVVRLKAVGRRGAQLHVQKSFHPQLTTFMGDIEVVRRFAIMHRVVTDPEDVIDLWSAQERSDQRQRCLTAGHQNLSGQRKKKW